MVSLRQAFQSVFFDHANKILKSASFHCECITIHRARRSYQVYRACRETWGPKNFQNQLTILGRRFLFRWLEDERNKGFKYMKSFLIAAVCTSSQDQEKKEDIIPDDELESYAEEIAKVQTLCESTITCSTCHKRVKFDHGFQSVSYCTCHGGPRLDHPHKGSQPWTPYLERSDLIVWRHSHPVHKSLYVYKVYGKYNDVTARDFLLTQLDTEYRRAWDHSVADLRVIESFPSMNLDVLYWEMEWPRMFANRDYVFVRRYLVDDERGIMVVVNKSYRHSKMPPKSRNHRVEEYYSVMVIKPVNDFDEPGIEFSLTYFDNPGLSLPQYIVSWVAMTGLPDFLGKLRTAAKAVRESNVPNQDGPSQLSDFEFRGRSNVL